MPPGNIGFIEIDSSGDAKDVSGLLRELATQAGRAGGLIVEIGGSPLPTGSGGIIVQNVDGPKSLPLAKELVAALADAGLPDVTLDTSVPRSKAGNVQIIVRAK